MLLTALMHVAADAAPRSVEHLLIQGDSAWPGLGHHPESTRVAAQAVHKPVTTSKAGPTIPRDTINTLEAEKLLLRQKGQ